MKGVFLRENSVLASHIDPWEHSIVHIVQYSVQCIVQCICKHIRGMRGVHALMVVY